MDTLNQMENVRVFQSDSNFVAVKIENVDMQAIREVLKEKGILIRLFYDQGEAVARISIAQREVMKEVVGVIKEYLQ